MTTNITPRLSGTLRPTYLVPAANYHRRHNSARTLISLSFLLLISSGLVFAETIQLRPARTVLNTASIPMTPGTYAIPCVADWNGDGRKDLLVGYRLADKVALFLNTGTDENPTFAAFTNLQAGGSDIYVQGAPSCGAPAPWVCDWNNDGNRDLLVGSGLDGTVWFYQNTNTDVAPQLAPGVRLRVATTIISVGYRATPYVHDWDQDGLPDLFCGQGDGYVYFFRNTNNVPTPTYSPGEYVQAGAATLNLGSRAIVRVFDWDGDGLKDLVGSSSTGVYWCRNTNSNAQPILQAKAALSAPVAGSGLVNIASSTRMRLDLTDWNNDGVMDLLLGKADGSVDYYEGYHLAFTNVVRLSSGDIAVRWNSAAYLRYHLLAGTSFSNITQGVVSNWPSGGHVTAYTNQAGGIQRYYRVQQAP